MKPATCKRCNTPNLYWTQTINGRWTLITADGQHHQCQSEEIRPVKCKYCGSDDLHWAEDTMPNGSKKGVLTESYGLPHACDEKNAFVAAERQKKKDEYAAAKARIEAIVNDSKCAVCDGSGRDKNSVFNNCESCQGMRVFSARNKKTILSRIRLRIWPTLNKNHW